MDTAQPSINQLSSPQNLSDAFSANTPMNNKDISSPPPKTNEFLGKMKIVIILFFILGSLLGIIKIAQKLISNIKPQPITITYWGLWEDEDTLKSIIEEYKVVHPNITVIYQKQSPSLYEERLQKALDKEAAPDIFRFHNTWLPMLKNYLSPMPLAVFTAQDYEKIFYRVAQSDLKNGSSYYGIPLEIDDLALFYNEDLFKTAALMPPTTWEGLYETAKRLTVKDVNGKIRTAGVAIGTTNNIDFWSDIIGLMFLQNGTDMKKIGSTILQDGSNAGEDTLSYYVNFAKGEDRVWDETLDNSSIAFAAGRLAMYFGTSRAIQEIRKLNPGLNFKIVPIPQLANQQTNWANYWVEGVNAKSSVSKDSWNFLKFLSAKENLQKRYEITAKTRLFGEPPSRTDMADSHKGDPFIGTFITQALTAKSWYLTDRTFEGEKGINMQVKKQVSSAIGKIIQGRTAKEALTETEKNIQQILVGYGLDVPVPSSSAR